jgi:tetratricopeptide (TPR) repeat protein
VSLLVLLSSLVAAGSVRGSTVSAEEAYKKGDFVTAEHEYAAEAQRSPKKPVLQFNAGTAAYRAGQFPEAAKAFQESISRAPSGDAARLADQEDAYYNLGNTLYRTGQKTEESAPQQTMQTWTQAVKAYETALQLRADDADSKFNRDFVKRKIEELKQKQNQPQNQPQNQNQPHGPQQGPPQNSPQQPNGGQPPPGQQPPGQQPPSQQPPGQQPPGQQPPGQQPPPAGAGQSKPGNGQPKPAADNDKSQPGEGAAGGDDRADAQSLPGQMSAEEARELLDSQKGEERHALGLPVARRERDAPPEKPVRDW